MDDFQEKDVSYEEKRFNFLQLFSENFNISGRNLTILIINLLKSSNYVSDIVPSFINQS